MRVLHVIKGLGPGGAERLLVSLTAARSSDVDVHVAYLRPDKSHLVPELEDAGAVVHLLGEHRGITDPRWLLRLRGLVGRVRPDVVHLHSPAVAVGARLVLRAARARPVIVSTEHNVWQSFTWATRIANAITLPLDDLSLAVSDEVRASAWPRIRARVSVVHQGIPVEAFVDRRGERAAARAALGVDDDTVVIVTVANFREKKDYPTLLAAAAACGDDPRLRFFAIGQGPLEAQLHEHHRELGLGDQFRFVGYHPDPPSIVVGADLFVLTSRHEGLSIAMLEAMALGVPPVAAAVGGVPEVVTDGRDGVLLPPGQAGELATALRRLAADPEERRALGARAAARAMDFDISRAQLDLEGRYRLLLLAKRPEAAHGA